MTNKAKIETIRILEDGETFTIQANFPEFTGPGGDPIAYTFKTTLQEYQNWTCPGGVTKNPENYIEYKYLRPAYTKLKGLYNAVKHLNGLEFDW